MNNFDLNQRLYLKYQHFFGFYDACLHHLDLLSDYKHIHLDLNMGQKIIEYYLLNTLPHHLSHNFQVNTT